VLYVPDGVGILIRIFDGAGWVILIHPVEC